MSSSLGGSTLNATSPVFNPCAIQHQCSTASNSATASSGHHPHSSRPYFTCLTTPSEPISALFHPRDVPDPYANVEKSFRSTSQASATLPSESNFQPGWSTVAELEAAAAQKQADASAKTQVLEQTERFFKPDGSEGSCRLAIDGRDLLDMCDPGPY